MGDFLGHRCSKSLPTRDYGPVGIPEPAGIPEEEVDPDEKILFKQLLKSFE